MELLIVMGIIALLAALLLGAISRVRELSRRTKCSSNQAQIAKGAVARATQDPLGIYIPTFNTNEHNLGYLYAGKFLTDPQVALCPSTDNTIREDIVVQSAWGAWDPHGLGGGGMLARLWGNSVPAGVTFPAAGVTDRDGVNTPAGFGGGISFDVWAWYSAGMWPDGTLIDWGGRDMNPQRGWGSRDPAVAALAPTYSAGSPGNALGPSSGPGNTTVGSQYDEYCDILKTNRQNFGQDSRILLTMDRLKGNITGWPDDTTNHGRVGVNISFLDGHAEWVDTSDEAGGGIDLFRIYMNSYRKPTSGSTAWTSTITAGKYSKSNFSPNQGPSRSLNRHTFTN
jgi:prepilin-type processing-associated H-X9-DG protein